MSYSASAPYHQGRSCCGHMDVCLSWLSCYGQGRVPELTELLWPWTYLSWISCYGHGRVPELNQLLWPWTCAWVDWVAVAMDVSLSWLSCCGQGRVPGLTELLWKILIWNRMTASVLKQDPNTKRFKRLLPQSSKHRTSRKSQSKQDKPLSFIFHCFKPFIV